MMLFKVKHNWIIELIGFDWIFLVLININVAKLKSCWEIQSSMILIIDSIIPYKIVSIQDNLNF